MTIDSDTNPRIGVTTTGTGSTQTFTELGSGVGTSPDPPVVDLTTTAADVRISPFRGLNGLGVEYLGTGDVNGDGIADLAVAAGFEGGPRVSVYDGKSVAAGTPVNLFNDFFIFDGPDSITLRNGAFIAMGDIDGDGFADIIGGGGPGGGPRVFALSGQDLLHVPAPRARVLANFFAGTDSNRGGVHIVAKNIDGDAFADLITGAGPGDGTRVTAYAGSSLATNPQPLYGFDAFGGFNTGVFVG